MASRNLSYPHPVLNNFSDDIGGEYNPHLKEKIKLKRNVIKIPLVNLIPENQTICSLVQDGKAEITVRFDCSRTFVRETFRTKSNTKTIELNPDDYYRKVKFQIRIVAINALENYHPENLHEDYEDLKFALDPGQILAESDPFEFNAEKEFDPLSAPVSSFLRVRCDRDLEEEQAYKIVLDDDKLEVVFDERSWNYLQDIMERSPQFLHATIVLHTLSQAIDCLQDYQNCLWASRLEQMLRERDLQNEESHKAAQKLLDLPFNRAVVSLNRLLQLNE